MHEDELPRRLRSDDNECEKLEKKPAAERDEAPAPRTQRTASEMQLPALY
jgi:hypothetical protein